MTINSMTGFARQSGALADRSWAWEFRSVNGKGLDIRLRLPPGFERLEAPSRKACAAAVSRGNVQGNLVFSSSVGASIPVVNEAALQTVLAAINGIDARTNAAPSTAAQVLAMRGVMEMSEPEMDSKSLEALDQALLSSRDQALAALLAHRAEEGAALGNILLGNIQEIERLVKEAEVDPSRTPAAIAERLGQQISRLTDAAQTLDQDRLYQEAVILATKADIREELDRLVAHIASARDLLNSDEPVGRKLEFLAQEFNREANTLCSKSNAVTVTEIGMALKVVIDQFREQVLNIE